MSNEESSYRLPTYLLRRLRKVKRIFLSVNPVMDYSDVLIDIEQQLASDDYTVDIVSVDKLSNLATSITSTALIICGDVPLKKLPSFIREKVHDDDLQVVNEPIWVALRVHVSSSGNTMFEFLSSDALETPEVSLSDSSWAQVGVLKQRIGQAHMLYSNGKNVRDREAERHAVDAT